jgi:peptidoglycan/LPS O-acetylase OafA/YrhL
LSYGAYLLHPLVLSAIYFSMTQMHRYSRMQGAFNFVATWGLSYACSAVMFLAVEKPVMNLETVIFRRLGLISGDGE